MGARLCAPHLRRVTLVLLFVGAGGLTFSNQSVQSESLSASPAILTDAPLDEWHVTLPIIMTCPTISFTGIPTYNTSEDLHGQVDCIDPAEYDDYAVAVYITVGGGWWTKPTFAAPLTTINADGSWVCDVTTGGNDAQATRFAAFLWPRAAGDPPQADSDLELPEALFGNPYVIADREPTHRTITFSGYTWDVKQSDAPVGPGPNYFSNATR